MSESAPRKLATDSVDGNRVVVVDDDDDDGDVNVNVDGNLIEFFNFIFREKVQYNKK